MTPDSERDELLTDWQAAEEAGDTASILYPFLRIVEIEQLAEIRRREVAPKASDRLTERRFAATIHSAYKEDLERWFTDKASAGLSPSLEEVRSLVFTALRHGQLLASIEDPANDLLRHARALGGDASAATRRADADRWHRGVNIWLGSFAAVHVGKARDRLAELIIESWEPGWGKIKSAASVIAYLAELEGKKSLDRATGTFVAPVA